MIARKYDRKSCTLLLLVIIRRVLKHIHTNTRHLNETPYVGTWHRKVILNKQNYEITKQNASSTKVSQMRIQDPDLHF